MREGRLEGENDIGPTRKINIGKLQEQGAILVCPRGPDSGGSV
jgi:hypothetical protein